MTPPEHDKSGSRSVLSWESVVDSDRTTAQPLLASAPDTASDPAPVPTTVPVPSPGGDAALTAGDAAPPATPPLAPVSLSIAPLSLEPLPPIPNEPATPGRAGGTADIVLGEIHLEVPPIAPPPAEARTESVSPIADEVDDVVLPPIVLENLELKIAPLDMPDLKPSGSTSVVVAAPETPKASPPPPPPAPQTIAPPARVDAPQAAAPPPASSIQQPAVQAAVQAAAPPPAQPAAPEAVVSSPGLPQDVVPADPTPTTVIPNVSDGQIPLPALPGTDPGSDTVKNATVLTLPQHQPNQAALARSSAGLPGVPQVQEAPPKNKNKKNKHKVQKQKSGGGSGIAVFFTLLVLVGLVVGAILFGRPYLFPDKWDVDAKPYGEAVETVLGSEIAEPLLITRHAESTYDVKMADAYLGEWEGDVPMWRSLGLVTGQVDAPLVRDLITGWIGAYYSPSGGEIVVDESLSAGAVDGAIIEAIAAAALDQQTHWSSTLDDATMDAAALTEARVIASSRTTRAATTYGPAVSERRIDVAAFLPPVLAYRVNAPAMYAELVPENAAALTAMLTPTASAVAPELIPGDVVVTGAIPVERSFWYLVFASYSDAPTAYAASTAIEQTSLATAERAGRTCSYGTFTGIDAARTATVLAALQQWVANAPVAMNASLSTLADGSYQLVSCDPGANFDSTARFGVARELIRWRLVELAALENVDPQGGTPEQRIAEVTRVQQTQSGIALMGLPFDTSAEESARLARLAAAPVLGVPAADPADLGRPAED